MKKICPFFCPKCWDRPCIHLYVCFYWGEIVCYLAETGYEKICLLICSKMLEFSQKQPNLEKNMNESANTVCNFPENV